MWGLHLNFLQLKITFPSNACTVGPHGGGGVGGSTATKGEVSVGDGFGVAAAPWRGSATLTCPNLGSPGRVVINY